MAEQRNREYLLNGISRYLSCLHTLISQDTAQSYIPAYIYDQIGCELLNQVFDYQLTPANQATIMRGVDLIDEARSIAVQVTTSNTRQKLDAILRIFSAGEAGQRLCDRFDSLIILILSDAPPPRSRQAEDADFTLQILNLETLFAYIRRLSIDKLERIHDYLASSLEGESSLTAQPSAAEAEPIASVPEPNRPWVSPAVAEDLAQFPAPRLETLRFACLLSPDGLPPELFLQCLTEQQRQELAPLVKEEYIHHESSRIFVSPGLRSDLLDELTLTRENCREFLDRLLQYDQTRYWRRLRLLRRREVLVLLAKTFAQAAQCLYDPDGSLALRAAAFYAQVNETSNELHWCLRAVQSCESVSLPDRWTLGNAYLRAADCCQRLGDNDSSYKYCKKLLSLCGEEPAFSSSDQVRIHYQTGLALVGLENHQQALKSLRKALDLSLQTMTADHPLRSGINSALSIAASAAGDSDAAREYALRSIRTDLPAVPPDTLSEDLVQKLDELDKLMKSPLFFHRGRIAELHTQIGDLYHARGNQSNALEHHLRALALLEEQSPPDHRRLADSYHSVGLIVSDLDEHEVAMQYLQKAAQIREKDGSIPPADLIRSYLDLGAVHTACGMHQYALEYYQKALELQRHSLPAGSGALADTYTALGNVYRTLGQDYASLRSYTHALDILEKALAPDAPALAAACMNVANACIQRSQYGQALEQARRALEIYGRTLPPEHPQWIIARQTVSWLEEMTE